MRNVILAAAIVLSAPALAKSIEIKMKNNGTDGIMVFDPGFVSANPGDTLIFVPADTSHNSISVVTPTGAKPWAGKPDQKVTVKLDKEGVYIFKCEPHVTMAMVGVVQVGKPTNLAMAKAEAEKLAATFVMSKDRLSKYLAQVK